MEQQISEVKQIKQLLTNTSNIRYRKISMSGCAVQAISSSIPCDPVRPKQLILSFPVKQTQIQSRINVKVVEEDYFKRYKAQTGIKSLLKAYDETRKKNSAEGMCKLGLDVMQIKSYSTSKPQTRGKISFPTPAIHSKGSLRKLDLRQLSNRQILSPLKNKSARQSKHPNQDQNLQLQFKHLVELTSTYTSVSPDKELKESKGLFSSKKKDPKHIFKKEAKAQDYLYRRLEGTQKNVKEEHNQVYDRRIKSYLDLLWKNMYAHNIYINLELKTDDINARPKKLKAYIALGNNGAMVRGLIKRRFWWTLVDERTPDCQFVWTQLKINQLFQKQKKTSLRKRVLKDEDWQEQESPSSKNKTLARIRLNKLPYPLNEQNNTKIMHNDDAELYRKYWNKFQRGKERDFAFKVQKNPKELDIISAQNTAIVHNHLEYNFFLGNKKALFYNLKEYYSLIGQNLFQRVPLTFHIRKGTKDPEYARFVEYYKRRAKMIQKESKEQEEVGGSKPKTRNIWIVKPGENSNQGRGITVIDQIYELNSIMKESGVSDKSLQQTERTYIVQMYIDRPLLYNNRKFDIRHYMLITNFFGVMRAYWYEEGYIRTSSYEFDIDTFEPEIHLTNDAIQKKYPQYGKYEPYNKISYEQFQRYLDSNFSAKKYNFKQQILPQMKSMATDAAKSVFTKIAPKNQMNNFEVFGLDFMIDKNFKPWLIEINTNPCLECNSPLLNRIIPYMLQQSFKLSLDLAYPPPCHYPNTCKHYAPLVALETFKYQLIFDSQHQGQRLTKMYKRVRSNFLEQIGEIEDDEEFKDEGKQCKLDDFT